MNDGVDVNSTAPTPADLIEAVNADDADRVARLLAQDSTLATARDPDGVSAIMLSRYRFARSVTDALLAVDPELDVFEATSLGFVDRLRERLEDDPSLVTAFSSDGFTALHFGGFFGKAEATHVLIEAGAGVDVYTRNAFANQPLHAAAAGRHHEVCRILLAAGADVNATQHGGYTPLHEAAQHGDNELVELFLSAGADPSIRQDDGETPAETAESAGHPDLAARIREVAAARE
jgi:ankyrin repeat protein